MTTASLPLCLTSLRECVFNLFQKLDFSLSVILSKAMNLVFVIVEILAEAPNEPENTSSSIFIAPREKRP